MKKKIFDALKTEYASLGLSDNTLMRIAAVLEGSIEKEEDIVTAAKGDTAKLLATSIQGETDGLKRAKQAAEAALADYKAKHPEGGEHKDDPELTQLKADLASQKSAFEELKANYERQVKQSGYAALRAAVKGKADELKVSNVPIWDDVVAAVAVDDNTTADTLLTSVKTAYEAKLKAYVGDGAAPYRGDGSPKPAEITTEDRAKKAKEDADRVRKS